MEVRQPRLATARRMKAVVATLLHPSRGLIGMRCTAGDA